MKFQLLVLPTIPRVLEDGAKLRPIGRNTDKYVEMLHQVRQLCILADDVGYDCFSITEHHFHSEGYEISVAPLLLFADLAARTKRIKFAPIGLVLTTWDPLRCAEELAVLDNLTEGRVMGGFARGSHNRWVSVLGQKYGVSGTFGADAAQDETNREVFEEMFEIMLKAWTEDSLEFDGKYYKIPHPREGIGNWLPQDWTKKRGNFEELDDQGRIRKVSVVPSPYQKPHPPLFTAYSASERTVRWAAKYGVIPSCLFSDPKDFLNGCCVYQEVAAEHGRSLKLGENMAACRTVTIGKTREEAYEIALEGTGRSYYEYFNQVGAAGFFRYPGEAGPITFKSKKDALDRLISLHFALVGTVDDVKAKMEALSRCHGNGDLEWCGLMLDHQGLQSLDVALEQVELFGTHVLPEFQAN